MLLKCSWAQRVYNTLESIIWFSDSPGLQLLLWFQSCILHITPIPIQSKDLHASFSGLHCANKIGRQTNTAAMHILQGCIVETNLVEKNRLHTVFIQQVELHRQIWWMMKTSDMPDKLDCTHSINCLNASSGKTSTQNLPRGSASPHDRFPLQENFQKSMHIRQPLSFSTVQLSIEASLWISKPGGS